MKSGIQIIPGDVAVYNGQQDKDVYGNSYFYVEYIDKRLGLVGVIEISRTSSFSIRWKLAFLITELEVVGRVSPVLNYFEERILMFSPFLSADLSTRLAPWLGFRQT